ncbi:MAG: hypothetical protein WA142_09095 [Rugosibacter sp.]
MRKNLEIVEKDTLGSLLIRRFKGWLNFTPEIVICKSPLTEPISTSTDEEPPSWESISGAQCIARWAEELRVAVASRCDIPEWRLVGTGAVIENNDLDACKSIFRRVAKDAGLRFLETTKKEVADIFLNAADTFLTVTPVMIYLEPGDWMLKTDAGNAELMLAFRKALGSFMKRFNPRQPVIFVTAVYKLTDMADMLRAPGLFDRRFALRSPTPLELGQEFLNQLGRDICAPSLADFPQKLGIIVGEYPGTRLRDLHVLHLQRVAAREKRQLELVDVVAVGFAGSVETDALPTDNPALYRSVAVHEAGHAVVSMIDSSGRNTPDFLSIRETTNYNGVSVDAYLYSYSLRSHLTYRDFRHQIRNYLAGRAAEEVVFGPENVTGGCRSDLINANALATKGFCCLGFVPHMDRVNFSGSNLAIVVSDEPDQGNDDYFGPMIRKFLADQYQEVIDMLTDNRRFLDEVTDALLQCDIMDQTTLTKLGSKYLQPTRNFLNECVT